MAAASSNPFQQRADLGPLRRSAALEFGQNGITVNAVCPTNVDTPMIQNPAMYSLFAPDIDNPTREDVTPGFSSLNAFADPEGQDE